jgi:SAM-dependent methyltransferase
MKIPDDVWAAANAYEPYIGRWSRLVARAFLEWLAAPTAARWLDIGCGTGALTSTVLATGAPDRVCSVDGSPAYVAFARGDIPDARATFAVADARQLPLPPASIHTVVSGLVLNFVPQPELAIAEMARVVRSGGTVGLYVWDYADGMQMIRHFWDAAIALDTRAAPLDEGSRFPVCQPQKLEELFEGAGLKWVESRAIEVPTHFRDFTDYWTPFLGGQGPAPGYAMSLDGDQRARLRDHLRAQLPTTVDGSIELIARAWAVRGRKP